MNDFSSSRFLPNVIDGDWYFRARLTFFSDFPTEIVVPKAIIVFSFLTFLGIFCLEKNSLPWLYGNMICEALELPKKLNCLDWDPFLGLRFGPWLLRKTLHFFDSVHPNTSSIGLSVSPIASLKLPYGLVESVDLFKDLLDGPLSSFFAFVSTTKLLFAELYPSSMVTSNSLLPSFASFSFGLAFFAVACLYLFAFIVIASLAIPRLFFED